jgi:hypothetical protein
MSHKLLNLPSLYDDEGQFIRTNMYDFDILWALVSDIDTHGSVRVPWRFAPRRRRVHRRPNGYLRGANRNSKGHSTATHIRPYLYQWGILGKDEWLKGMTEVCQPVAGRKQVSYDMIFTIVPAKPYQRASIEKHLRARIR